MKSLYEVTKDSAGINYFVSGFYFAINKKRLFFGYPYELYKNNSSSDFTNVSSNPTQCIDDITGLRPDYFSFICRPWFTQFYADVKNGNELSISAPYVDIIDLKDNNPRFILTVTLCLNLETRTSDTEDISCVCTDIEINNIFDSLEGFNALTTSGYFAVIYPRIHSSSNSSAVFYYPNMAKYNRYQTWKFYNFGVNKTFYLNDTKHFTSVQNNFLMQKFTDSRLINQTLNYKKGNDTITLYPIFINNDNLQPNSSLHLLTIGFFNNESNINNEISKVIQNQLFPRIMVQLLAFLILCLILILIVRNLLFGIADNIVKPIRNINNMILDMRDQKEKNFLKEEKNKDDLDFFENEKDDFLKMEENNYIQQINNVDSEEVFEIRSEEISKLFDILLQLKGAINVSSKSNVLDKSKLINFVVSKYVFKDVSNLKGWHICDSNVGNFLLKWQKYDKAIIHFLETINLTNFRIPDEYSIDNLTYTYDQEHEKRIGLPNKADVNPNKIGNSNDIY